MERSCRRRRSTSATPTRSAIRCSRESNPDGTSGGAPPAGARLRGYPDEAQEIPGPPMPLSFSRNGTFMAYRKLHQNVDAFRKFIGATAVDLGKVSGLSVGHCATLPLA